MGVMAGLAGIIMTSRVASASAVAGESYEMDVIAGVVLGGTLQSGGKGSVAGTVIGIFIFGVIENGLNILGLPTYYKLFIKGTGNYSGSRRSLSVPEQRDFQENRRCMTMMEREGSRKKHFNQQKLIFVLLIVMFLVSPLFARSLLHPGHR